MTVFFTSDTHFGDRRVLQIDRRPFGSVALHDAALVARWNELVASNDEVWHLGDFALGAKLDRGGSARGAQRALSRQPMSAGMIKR
jgi:calcineurin-like phosphoesterase family protein